MVQIEVLASTLIAGLIIGYLAQRARMCFVGGVRDFTLVKDTHLLKALGAFLIGALAFFAIAAAFSAVPKFPWILSSSGLNPIPGAPLSSAAATPLWVHITLAVIGGLGIGAFSVFAGGCPLRQHIMASEGDKSSMSYLAGFYIGAIIFTIAVAPTIVQIFS
ncbi:MAG: YeeE/YedE family protein [Candidatus Bathyarchaeota archaeon]|nr:YeeE/YedE family protein [Candidatus Bathyarchaeota archaeon]